MKSLCTMSNRYGRSSGWLQDYNVHQVYSAVYVEEHRYAIILYPCLPAAHTWFQWGQSAGSRWQEGAGPYSVGANFQ